VSEFVVGSCKTLFSSFVVQWERIHSTCKALKSQRWPSSQYHCRSTTVGSLLLSLLRNRPCNCLQQGLFAPALLSNGYHVVLKVYCSVEVHSIWCIRPHCDVSHCELHRAIGALSRREKNRKKSNSAIVLWKVTYTTYLEVRHIGYCSPTSQLSKASVSAKSAKKPLRK
jgi:hypothetical protein